LWGGRKQSSYTSAPIDFAPSLAARLGENRRRRIWPKVLLLGAVAAMVSGVFLTSEDWKASLMTSVDGLTDKAKSLVPEVVVSEPPPPPPPPPVTISDVADVLTGPVSQNVYPRSVQLSRGEELVDASVEYSFDPILQTTADGIFERYKPDYGAFVAIDPSTGQILAMSSYTKVDESIGNLALRSSFPAASVFKIIPAAAGLDTDVVSPGTILPFNGKSTALYKKHVLRHKNTKWTRKPTLREAFAKSINPVFGRLGVYDLGRGVLTDYAEQFGFNQAFDFEVMLPTSGMQLAENDEWAVAESASGYTRNNTLSPVHAAMLAATIVNDGVMMQPRLLNGINDTHGKAIYSPTLTVAGQPISPQTALEMRELMQATVKRGSASKPFRGFFRGDYTDVEVGGKTGTLTGSDPQGRNDWFVGYAMRGDRRLAFAALCVNVEKWTVKSGTIARIAIESWFDKPSEVVGTH